MAERATITVHTSPETRDRLERLASATRRSKSFLGNEALERYLDAEEGFVSDVLKGVEQADAGRVYSGAEVKEHLHRAVDTIAGKQTPA